MSDLQNQNDSQIPEVLMNVVIDEETPQNAPLAAKYKRSFAYPSMKDRCPVILSKIVDLLYRDKQTIVDSYGEVAHEEIKQAIGDISQLKNVLQTGKPFELFSSSEPDTSIWNSHIKQLSDKGVKLNYYEADWLFAECYLYRKLREIFATKKYLNTFDPFATSKRLLLNESLPAIVPLLKHLEGKKLYDGTTRNKDEMEKELTELFKCTLWGNRLDLSLSGGTATVDADADIFQIVDMWDHNILINDLDKAISIITNETKSNKVIAYVMDNTGMEALTDLCLADYLVTHGGVSEIKFRVKPIPWYVSDVTVNDFHNTVEFLCRHSDPIISKFGERWRSHLDSGLWSVVSDVFWCLGFPYSEMVNQDPALYKTLSGADLIIFKGDLNYRKLLQDINWEPTTPFSVALGMFHPAPLLTVRTNKADLICGLQEGEAEELNLKDPRWMVSGDFAVFQFYSP